MHVSRAGAWVVRAGRRAAAAASPPIDFARPRSSSQRRRPRYPCLLCVLAGYYNNLFVGVVGCRPERRPDGKQRLYVAVLGVLAAYRGRGLGTKLLQSVIDAVPSHDDVVEVYLHVHTANPRAVALYEKVGFENVGVIKGYYSAAALTPPDCVLLRKVFGDAEPSVSIEHGGLGAPAPVAAEDA